MPSPDARAQGQRGEFAAVRKLGGQVVGEGHEAVDVIAPNGTGYQVKAPVYHRADGSNGVVRVSKPHLDTLQSKFHQAGIVVVLMPSVGTTSATPLSIETVPISTVRDVVDGRWYPETREYEIPWPRLLDY